MTRAGIGYDLHRLVIMRKFVLGGIVVPFDRGPAGHSDGDVLVHAICDALLGAAGLGDIARVSPTPNRRGKACPACDSLRPYEHCLPHGTRALSILTPSSLPSVPSSDRTFRRCGRRWPRR